MTDCQIQQLLLTHCKSIQRLGWKHLDAEQFTETYLGLLKALIKITDSPTKSQLSRLLDHSSFNLSSGEAYLFARQVRDAITFCRRKARDAGSGKFMPGPIQTLTRLLKKPGKSTQKSAASSSASLGASSEPKASPEIRTVFGLGKKKEPLDILSVASSAPTSPMAEPGASSSSVAGPSSSALPSSGSF